MCYSLDASLFCLLNTESILVDGVSVFAAKLTFLFSQGVVVLRRADKWSSVVVWVDKRFFLQAVIKTIWLWCENVY